MVAVMKKVSDIFKEKEQTYSFELFPPKTDEGYQKLIATIGQLAGLKPDFISCTYGAGGGNRDKTLEIVERIEKEHQISGVAHLTCVLNTKDQIKDILTEIKNRGICNVLALRGDPPKDQPNWQPGPDNFKYSSELVAFIRQHFGDHFSIGVAGFPEGHILCPDRDQDAKFLKMKIDAGADYVITQLFFNNRDYFQYMDRLEDLGIKARVIPGIIPITDYHAIVKFCQSCGAGIPQKITAVFDPIQDDKDAVLKTGIECCTVQCRELLSRGAPGVHFYTLNKFHPTDVILPAIRR